LRILVLDTSAFIMGFNPTRPGEVYTVEAVEDELSKGTMTQLRFHVNKEKGTVILRSPSPRAIESVEAVSAKAGEKGHVSRADREVVALALDLKQDGQDPVIVSDDYGVQNMAEHLHLNYGSLANFGIAHKFDWIMYCPACHRRSTGPEKTCRVCGTELKRKVLSRSKLARDKLVK
jgi:rRNA maturation endonuclease Nob1